MPQQHPAGRSPQVSIIQCLSVLVNTEGMQIQGAALLVDPSAWVGSQGAAVS